MSLPKSYWPVVAIIVLLSEGLIAHAIGDMVSPHGYIWSKTLLSISLVEIIFNINWCTCLYGALANGFL